METKIRAESAVSFQKEVKKNATIDKQTNRMGRSDLDRALSEWLLRDTAN